MAEGETKELTLEIRVGGLILAALTLLAAFIFGLGGPEAFTEGKSVYVDFTNPGLVPSGAPVRIGSVVIGRVDAIEYRGGNFDDEVGRPVHVRMRLNITPADFESIHEDARISVSMTNPVGDLFVTVNPGSPDAPLVENGAVLVGLDPPDMNRLLSKAYDMLTHVNDLVRDNRTNIDSIITSGASTTQQINGLVERHGDRVDRIIDNIEQITEEGNELGDGVSRLANSRRIDSMETSIDGITESVDEHFDPLRTSVESIVDKGDSLLDDVWGEEQQAQVDQMLEAGPVILDDIDVIAGDAQELIAYMEGGRGSIGALMNDQELVGEVQELVRDLKHNPWRLFWAE